jgi:hypothetical protein
VILALLVSLLELFDSATHKQYSIAADHESCLVRGVCAAHTCRSSYLLKQRRVVADKLKCDSLVKHPASSAALIAASGTTAQGIDVHT